MDLMKIPKSRAFKVIVCFLVIFLTFLFVYTPHLGYIYPLHADEWVRITASIQLNRGSFERFNIEPTRYTEIGFISFLGILSRFARLFGIYRFLPPLFACLSSACLFLLVHYLTRKYWVSILAMLFFASLKSNTNLLGLWFFTPLTMALPFLLLYSLCLIHGLKKNYFHLIISAMLLAIIALIHPISAMFIFLVSIVYGLLNYRLIKLKHTALLILPFLIAFWLKVPFLNKSFFIFNYGWTNPEINYSLPFLYGMFPLLLAFFGAWHVLSKKEDSFFFSWFIVSFALFIFFRIFRFTLFVPYIRDVFYLMVGLAPLSAIGMFYVICCIKKLKMKNFLLYTLLTILVLVVFVNAFWGYKDFHKQKFYDFYGTAKQARVYRCVENSSLIVEEAAKCVYPNQVEYLSHLIEELPLKK